EAASLYRIRRSAPGPRLTVSSACEPTRCRTASFAVTGHVGHAPFPRLQANHKNSVRPVRASVRAACERLWHGTCIEVCGAITSRRTRLLRSRISRVQDLPDALPFAAAARCSRRERGGLRQIPPVLSRERALPGT